MFSNKQHRTHIQSSMQRIVSSEMLSSLNLAPQDEHGMETKGARIVNKPAAYLFSSFITLIYQVSLTALILPCTLYDMAEGEV